MQNERNLIKRTTIPITIKHSPLLTAVANFHKPYSTPILPAIVDAESKITKFTLKSKDDQYHHPDKKNINIKYYDISVQSKALQDRLFKFKIPINLKKNEESNQYICLNFSANQGSLQILNTYVDGQQVLTQNQGEFNLNFNQKFMIQQSLMGNRRKELTERDVLDMQQEESSNQSL